MPTIQDFFGAYLVEVFLALMYVLKQLLGCFAPELTLLLTSACTESFLRKRMFTG